MPLKVHLHPLSSYCWKVLIGLYENGTPFEPVVIDFGDEASRNAFHALWPLAKMPVLEDTDRGEAIPESSIIYDYLDAHYPGAIRFVPLDPDAAWRTRLWDRLFDLHLHHHMQRVIADRLRPGGRKDPFGVEEARGKIVQAYGVIETAAAGRAWFSEGGFGLADCAAAPALYYADKVQPLSQAYPATSAYLDRLKARPSFARVLAEAEPFFKYFPSE